jgi:hypothetical protein
MADGTLTHVQALKEGKTVKFRPKGNSMRPIIESGQLVTVTPISAEYPNGSSLHMPTPRVGDVVLCKVNGRQMLHKVTAVSSDGRFQISNNHGYVNGWTTLKNVFGILTQVEP